MKPVGEKDQNSDGETTVSTIFDILGLDPICDCYHSIINNITVVSARSARTIPITGVWESGVSSLSGVWGGAPAENVFSNFI